MKDIFFQLKLKRIEKRGEKQKAKQELIDKYAPYYPSKRRKVSNVMLVVIVIAIVWYTVASFAIQYFTNIYYFRSGFIISGMNEKIHIFLLSHINFNYAS